MSGAGKHILCTGGAGYIGSHTVIQLLENGYEVSILDNFLNSKAKSLERILELSGKKPPLFEIDMCNEEAIKNLFKDNKFDGVIHFAGLKAVGESVAKPIWYYENNIVGTLNILKAMAGTSCKAIVFSSSATVYRPCDEPIDEEKPLGCSNPYGWTKYMIEQILSDAAIADKNLGVSLLRYFNPVGNHASGRIGESPNQIPNNLMPFVQQVAVGRREIVNVFGNDYDTPDGTGVRDYIHVEDLAAGHIAALANILKLGTGVTIHNLGSGRGYSVLEMIAALEKAAGKKIPYKVGDRRPGDLATVVANAAKAKAELGWETKRTLEDMCTSAWKWQSENPYGFDEPPAGA
jgi:UDP-glucose 4-epimerase